MLEYGQRDVEDRRTYEEDAEAKEVVRKCTMVVRVPRRERNGHGKEKRPEPGEEEDEDDQHDDHHREARDDAVEEGEHRAVWVRRLEVATAIESRFRALVFKKL